MRVFDKTHLAKPIPLQVKQQPMTSSLQVRLGQRDVVVD